MCETEFYKKPESSIQYITELICIQRLLSGHRVTF